jgi:hypothetical protein
MGTEYDGDTGGLAIVELVEEEEFKNLLDIRFVTVNRIGQKLEAEVVLSGEPLIDEARIQEALEVGRAHGQHAYARKHGFCDSVLIYFTPDTAAST